MKTTVSFEFEGSDPDILAAEIMEDLRAALEQFSDIAGELSSDSPPDPERHKAT